MAKISLASISFNSECTLLCYSDVLLQKQFQIFSNKFSQAKLFLPSGIRNLAGVVIFNIRDIQDFNNLLNSHYFSDLWLLLLESKYSKMLVVLRAVLTLNYRWNGMSFKLRKICVDVEPAKQNNYGFEVVYMSNGFVHDKYFQLRLRQVFFVMEKIDKISIWWL